MGPKVFPLQTSTIRFEVGFEAMSLWNKKGPGRDVAVWPGLFIRLCRKRPGATGSATLRSSVSWSADSRVIVEQLLAVMRSRSSEAGAACLQTEAKNHAADRAA
jgi:hypothetical protein